MTADADNNFASENFEFTPDLLEEAKNHVKKYPAGRQFSAVMPLLDLAQRQNGGWISKAAINYVAKFLEMPPIRVLEVASFYTMYNLSPIGKFHVQVCTNLPCWLRGSDQIFESCKNNLNINEGDITDDGLFTLSAVECLGACVNAPMMQINEDYYEDLTPNLTEDILSNLRVGGKPRAGSQIGRHTCEPKSGLTSLMRKRTLEPK